MPMDAYLLADRLVVHVDLLDADPQTASVTLDRDVLLVRAVHTSRGRADASYARSLTLAPGLGPDRVRARVHDGIVTVTLDLGPGQDRARPAARRCLW
jgi:HSP20 family molecular chaperone IbpA